ncbi:MAG: bifunctional UDP-N-acetylmuramoyl-tripeptide:D-alanyl-D-alanine ligase/alanine racemase [Bacteroidales bacterium]|nr:bifunctional UDP-N-acetylmuramoyl-tripeptide:D-alanyl-D-alanine ligase/alanine racemase [Bacteroidales bacterium]
MKALQIDQHIKSTDTLLHSPESECSVLLTDSRRLVDANRSIFFAIQTKRNSGCRYVKDLYAKGVRNFVLPFSDGSDTAAWLKTRSDTNLWTVDNVVAALQGLAAWHRSQYSIPVVGITGSNGKTIVKDWIVQMLSSDHHVVSSPKSYNSQIGVPLSVWQLNDDCDIAVFEAGISETGEMTALQHIIDPVIGIFTNIGQAHDENFLTRGQKIAEKLQLFTHCKVLIYCTDHKEIHNVLSEKEHFRNLELYTWGSAADNRVVLLRSEVVQKSTHLFVKHDGQEYEMIVPFVDRASAENAMHCITLLFYLGYDGTEIAARCRKLVPVAMRLEMNEGINNCLLINDSYSLDLNSLAIALDFLQYDNQHFRRTLIMSDMLQTGLDDHELYTQVASLAQMRGVSKFIGIGEALSRHQSCFDGMHSLFFTSVDEFLQNYDFSSFQSETILVKGARKFGFETIVKALQRKSHETIMEVNLDAMVANLNYYRSLIKPTTKLMAMVKASSYGAGKVEVASTLQYNHVDYLTVAYSDEGVELRRNGITLPIMVMNPEEESFGDIIRHRLEPDIYSFRILEAFSETVSLYHKDDKYPVHIEFDTGMHRLGFSGNEVERLAARLKAFNCNLHVESVFSHLACSEDPDMDWFTRQQIDRFSAWSQALKEGIGRNDVCCHILNSSGISRFPEAQMDMVRLGIGLYGIAPDEATQAKLQPVSRLKTRISQLKKIPEGDTVGYNRRWVAKRDSTIAILSIGYADGLNRHLGYGRGTVAIGDTMAPIVGSVCMDMCFVDVTGIPCREGDEVELFGSANHLKAISEAADTIPYEILTSVSPRVKRVYYQQ